MIQVGEPFNRTHPDEFENIANAEARFYIRCTTQSIGGGQSVGINRKLITIGVICGIVFLSQAPVKYFE